MGDKDDPKRRMTDIENRIDSQNGEDGIIAFLVDALDDCDRRYLEIGCGSGKRNNCTQLARQGWFGIAIDRKHKRIGEYRARCKADGIEHIQLVADTLTQDNAPDYAAMMPDPDVFSIDIDSIDWHVAKAMLEAGFRPKIAVCEYNAGFMAHPVTVPYKFPFTDGPKHIYFGASVEAWKSLWQPYGYRFVTVESTGVNCFFAREGAIDLDCLDGVEWLNWADSAGITSATGMNAKRRWATVSDKPLQYV